MLWTKLGRDPLEGKKNTYHDLDKLPMPTVNNLKEIKNYVRIRGFNMLMSQFEGNKDWMIYAISKNVCL